MPEKDFELIQETIDNWIDNPNDEPDSRINDLALFNVAVQLSEHRNIKWTLELLSEFISRIKKDLDDLEQ